MFLFRISVRVAVLNFYRLISTKGINQAKLKDGRDLIADHDLHLIDISISYDPACDEVYHWAISDYPVDEFSYSDSFWNSVIAYAENHFEDSDLVLFTTTIYDTSDSSVDASLSSESNLR